MVHPKGFEPLTARFVAGYSIQLSYGCKYKIKNGASEGIRTPDRPVRSRVLYPAELRMHILILKMAVREGFEPSMQLLTAYSLSRGAPSASRPSHQNIMILLQQQNHNVWRTYYVLEKISQTFF